MRICLNDLPGVKTDNKEGELAFNVCPACRAEMYYGGSIHGEDELKTDCPVCHNPLPLGYYRYCGHGLFRFHINKGRISQADYDAFCIEKGDLVDDRDYLHSQDVGFDFLNFRLMRQDRIEAEKRYNVKYAQFDSYMPSATLNASGIKTNVDEMKKYLQNLFTLETNIYSIGKRLIELYTLQQKHKCDLYRRKILIGTDLRTQTSESKSQYDNALAELNRVQSAGAEKVSVARPEEPRKPAVPVLEKPGLFNKKKVLAHNDELTAAYEKSCQQYEKDMAAHKLALDECAAKEAQLVKEAEARYAQSLAAAEAEVAKAKARMEQSAADIDAQIEAACALPSPETVAKQMLDDEIAQAEKLLKELIECRNKLYACDVVFIKYRNMVALATFCEYLMAGRCTTLEGPDGAYNIFEAECRANQIIGQLTKIVDSLEQIKESQYLIYSQLQRINTSLTTMNATMQSMSKSLQSIQADTHDMSGYMEKVAQNSDVIAHNTAVSAYYAKLNAELTNSLGYLVALH